MEETINGLTILKRNERELFLIIDDNNYNRYLNGILTQKVRCGIISSFNFETSLFSLVCDSLFLQRCIIGVDVDERNDNDVKMMTDILSPMYV